MKNNDLSIIENCPLFAGIAPDDLPKLLDCLRPVRKSYARSSVILEAGEAITSLGIVLSGQTQVIQEDFWGNRTILARVSTGGLFAEAFACAGVERAPVSVIAVEASVVLFVDYRKIITTCTPSCTFHAQLLGNMIGILASKSVGLTGKLWQVTRRSTREKLLSYLSAVATEVGSDHFDIPFNRQELADYLSVDRSAMSAELSRMRQDGLLAFERSHFELLRVEE